MNSKQGFPVFNTVIYANYISKKDKIASDSLTDEDIQVLIWKFVKFFRKIYFSKEIL